MMAKKFFFVLLLVSALASAEDFEYTFNTKVGTEEFNMQVDDKDLASDTCEFTPANADETLIPTPVETCEPICYPQRNPDWAYKSFGTGLACGITIKNVDARDGGTWGYLVTLDKRGSINLIVESKTCIFVDNPRLWIAEC